MSELVADTTLTLERSAAADLPAWLRERKRADWETLQELPMPNASMEDWRRTDVSGLVIDDYPLAACQTEVTAPEELRAQGVIVTSLEAAAATHPEQVQRHLDQVVAPVTGKFAALNASYWRGGTFVLVPKGVEATLAISAVTGAPGETSRNSGVGPSVLPRALVVVEDGASLTYTDEFNSKPTGAPLLSSAVTEIVVGDGARLQYLVLQEWSNEVSHFATHRVHLGRDSQADLVIASTGAKLSKTYVDLVMLGSGSSARISGLVIGDGHQHFDYQSLQDHHAPNCTTDLLVKSALRDSAVSIYSGLIKIRKDAQHSDAYQANRNLMLSPTAKADSIPRLEIEANDVRCTHGATVGQVDADQLFYLRSRGIDTREAQNVLVHGFFQPVIDRVAVPEARERIHQAIDLELEGLG